SMIARCPLDEIRTALLGRQDEAALAHCSGKNELSRQRCRFGSIGCEQSDWRDTRDSARRQGVRTAPVLPVREKLQGSPEQDRPGHTMLDAHLGVSTRVGGITPAGAWSE